MIIRKIRLQKGWSQDQLAMMAGLNIRTIQRIERGQRASMESLKAIAAVYEIKLTDLTQEIDMNTPQTITSEEQMALEYVRELKGLYANAATYLVFMVFLFAINYLTNPSYIWAWWAALGWGIGVVCHALSVFQEFEWFGPAWEKRQVEKRLGRKL